MKKRRLFWQVFPGILLLSIGSLVLVSWLVTRDVREFYMAQLKTDLETRARLVESHLSYNSIESVSADSLIKGLRESSGCRITIIETSGNVIADSDELPDLMENHADRPEILAALESGTGRSIRYSPTLGVTLMYFAIKTRRQNADPVITRVSLPMNSVEEVLDGVYSRIMFSGLFIAFLAALASFLLTRRIARPIEEIRKGTDIIASGNFDHTLRLGDSLELANLANSINEMANQLSKRIGQVTMQRNELEAMLESMIEGVIVLNREQRITRLNEAAITQLSITTKETEGKLVEEVIRVATLQQFVIDTCNSTAPIQRELVLNAGEKIMEAHGSLLQDNTGNQLGALIVLHDVTSMKRLEDIRREFVANVSHELRTPITSIKGYIETLQDGAIDDPDNAMKFLSVAARQIEKLNAIIDDLLNLARIEAQAGQAQIEIKDGQLLDVLNEAVTTNSKAAEAGNVNITIDCPPELTLKMNLQLMTHAVSNLLDNALRYSPEQSVVKLSAFRSNDKTIISVTDQGPGISPEHHTRLFERFYRVSQDRKAGDGGTGLGLAIVKHIAIVHGGGVAVDSTPGHGSEFRIVI
ncbi:ATP-binding protein [Calditrichota bacterium]